MAERLRCYLDARVPGPWLPIPPSSRWTPENVPIGPDPKAGRAGGILGCVVAQAGPFKSEGRGRFDEDSLHAIQDLWPAEGAPCHSQHANLIDDRTEWFLGRMTSPRRSVSAVIGPDGSRSAVACIRADLLFDPAAKQAPSGDLVSYYLSRAQSDPDSLSSSLVLAADVDDWSRVRDAAGNLLPPLWTPAVIFGSDIVDMGDAVGSLLGCAGAGLPGLRRLARERHATLSQQETEPDTIVSVCLPTRTPLRCGDAWMQLDGGALPADPTASYAGVPVLLDGSEIATVGKSAQLHATHRGLAVEFEPTGYVRQLHDIGRLQFSAEWSGRAGEHIRCKQFGHPADGWRVGLVRDAPEIRRIVVSSR